MVTMAAEVVPSASQLKEFVCGANEAIHIKFVKTPEDVYSDEGVFHPEFTHQLFGDNEVIFGYRGLRVELYYSAGRLTPYLSMKCTEQIDPTVYKDVKADEVLSVIAEHLPKNFLTNKDEFTRSLAKEKSFRPLGELLHVYKTSVEGQEKSYEIYKATIFTPGFLAYHERLQTFVLWTIENSSFIDVDDENWVFYLLFECVEENGEKSYSVVGYVSTYIFYAYPDKIRPRISQMVILPPFQRQGHGSQLLDRVFMDLREQQGVVDIAVEDPSEGFISVRDYVDCKSCCTLPSFRPPSIHGPFSKAMIDEAREKLCVNKMQARKVYEILRLYYTDMSDEAARKAYRLMVKQRLNRPFQKEQADIARLAKKNVLSPEELAATSAGSSLEERHQYLRRQYDDQIKIYQKILLRLGPIS